MMRNQEERVGGRKCPKCGSMEIYVCQPCGRQKLKCHSCNYLAYPKRFIRVES